MTTRALHDMHGRTAVVTGASSGIGREIARGLAERGVTVLALSREGGAGAQLVEELRQRTGDASHVFLGADLSSQAEVRAVAARVRERAPRLDVLASNAGAFFSRRTLSADGIEMTFALDHLGGMLLTLLLLEPLARAGGRVVLTSSLVAHWAWLHRDVTLRRGYNGFLAYSQAKLANALLAVELGRRLPPSTVAVNAFDPGVVATGFGRGRDFLNLCIALAQRWTGKSPGEAATTGLMLAADPSLEGETGGFWRGGRRVRLPLVARSPRAAARLWDVSLEMLDPREGELAALERLQRAARPSGPGR